MIMHLIYSLYIHITDIVILLICIEDIDGAVTAINNSAVNRLTAFKSGFIATYIQI